MPEAVPGGSYGAPIVDGLAPCVSGTVGARGPREVAPSLYLEGKISLLMRTGHAVRCERLRRWRRLSGDDEIVVVVVLVHLADGQPSTRLTDQYAAEHVGEKLPQVLGALAHNKLIIH